jgi:predicted dehydrogenase
MLRAFLQNGILVPPIEILFIEGGAYNWESVTDHRATDYSLDGGVIHDEGTHVLDLVGQFLGDLNVDEASVSLAEALVDRDTSANNFRGRFCWKAANSIGNVLVKISRSINMQTRIVIRGSNLTISSRSLFDDHILVVLKNGERIPVPSHRGLQNLKDLDAAFYEQWDTVASKIQGAQQSNNLPNIKAQTVLPGLRLIDMVMANKKVYPIDNYFLHGASKW